MKRIFMMTRSECPCAAPAVMAVAAESGCRGAAQLRDICLFISEYSAWLLGCGATCIRLERNVKRMTEALGCEAVMTILPRHIHLSVCLPDKSDSYTCIIATRTIAVSFNINTRLSELSWALADRKISFSQAKEQFEKIIHTPSESKFLVLILASLANAAFCRLFNGDRWAVGVVFVSTFAGYFLKQVLCEYKTDMRIVFVLCAFASSVLGAGAALFHLGTTPETAVGTSVLYLIPGIPFLNSFSDMLAGHYICSACRFIHAAILTCSLSLGLCGGLLMMNLGMF